MAVLALFGFIICFIVGIILLIVNAIKKKPKKVPIILLLVAVVCFVWLVILFMLDTSTPSTETPSTAQETVTEQQEEENAKPTEAEIEKEYKDSCIEINYKKLLRNPDKYVGKNIHFKGTITYVYGENSELEECCVATGKNEYDILENPLMVGMPYQKDGTRYLVDDEVEVWGEFQGMKNSTETVFMSSSELYVAGRYVDILEKSE